MKSPKEDPEDKKERERERKRSIFERRRATEEQAESIGTDLQSVYGLPGLNMFSGAPTSPASTYTPPKNTRTGDDR